jgi:hypothetical protein
MYIISNEKLKMNWNDKSFLGYEDKCVDKARSIMDNCNICIYICTYVRIYDTGVYRGFNGGKNSRYANYSRNVVGIY